ncbi:MAG: hypothetical protein Q9227_005322 [Pyrenula ochraceoflavens]
MFSKAVLVLTLLSPLAIAQDGYIGYSLSERGDQESVVYDTVSTPYNGSTTSPPPDVYLNASVHVGEIDILVANLTAQVNLAAEVKSLLTFNAGVDASIDRVSLLIQNVTARVTLEARLSNLVLMVNDVLNSLDLNPVIATLANDVGGLVNETASGLTGALGGSSSSSGGATASNSSSSGLAGRGFGLLDNILYSVNDYSGNTHTNRILEQNGDLVDQSLNNYGHITGSRLVGNVKTDMTFTGHNVTIVRNGESQRELEFLYKPFAGLQVVSLVYTDNTGLVVGTKVLSEIEGGGTSTIGDL